MPDFKNCLKISVSVIALCLTSPLSVAYAQGAGPAPTGPARAMPVNAATVVFGDHTITQKLPGRVKARAVAEIKPQVSGIIKEVLFDDGAVVAAGQAIYKIEDDSYAAAAAAADAAVAQARAAYDFALTDEKRALELFEQNASTAQIRDSKVAARQAAEATLRAAEAQSRIAAINLERTTIRSPIDGRIGLSNVSVGALVAAQQVAPLVTVRTLDEVHVEVAQSATDLLRWNSSPERREMQAKGEATLILNDGSTYPERGKLLAAEPQVQPTTGMITLRLTFPNQDGVLLPGMYVETLLPLAVIPNAAQIPQNAVMRERDGTSFVFAIKDGIVEKRTVVVVGASANQWVISEGLSSGDQVVTGGFQKIAPGAAVMVAADKGADQ